jgi:hypothetical protein
MPPVLCSFAAIEASPIRPRRSSRAPHARTTRRASPEPPPPRRSRSLTRANDVRRDVPPRHRARGRAQLGLVQVRSRSRDSRHRARRPERATRRLPARQRRGYDPPTYSAPPRPAPATSGASPPRLPASPRANARPAACVTETARVTWQTRRHVATGRIPTPLAADAARPRAIERRRGPRAGTRARSPTRRLASAKYHRGGPSRASAPRDDDVVAPYPQLDREPGGFVTCRVSDALSRFRRRRKRREDLDETVGVESSSNALAPTGRRVRRGRAIIRAPIILTDPPPSSPRGGFVVSPLFLFFSARSLREEPRGDA